MPSFTHLPGCGLSLARITQTSAMKTRFQIAECNLLSAKILKTFYKPCRRTVKEREAAGLCRRREGRKRKAGAGRPHRTPLARFPAIINLVKLDALATSQPHAKWALRWLAEARPGRAAPTGRAAGAARGRTARYRLTPVKRMEPDEDERLTVRLLPVTVPNTVLLLLRMV